MTINFSCTVMPCLLKFSRARSITSRRSWLILTHIFKGSPDLVLLIISWMIPSSLSISRISNPRISTILGRALRRVARICAYAGQGIAYLMSHPGHHLSGSRHHFIECPGQTSDFIGTLNVNILVQIAFGNLFGSMSGWTMVLYRFSPEW